MEDLKSIKKIIILHQIDALIDISLKYLHIFFDLYGI